MFTIIRVFFTIAVLFSQCLHAASVEEYVKVCTDNQGNKMGPELCECMGNKSKDLTEEEFDFFYAIAAKYHEKVNKGHATLDPNQKVNVMQLTMMGPSKCANELAAQQNSSNSQNSSESASSATSSTSSEAADSALQ